MTDIKNRIEPRLKALKGGKIIFNNKSSSVDCIINSRSATGFGLKMASTVGIPDRFELLETTTNMSHQVKVAWRRPKQLGVKLTEEK